MIKSLECQLRVLTGAVLNNTVIKTQSKSKHEAADIFSDETQTLAQA